MSIIVDTTVWSVALRRAGAPSGAPVRELTSLIHEGRIVMVGAIRQELLSGIRGAGQFKKVRDHLRAFEDLALDHIDHENAGACFNEFERKESRARTPTSCSVRRACGATSPSSARTAIFCTTSACSD